MAEWLAGRGVSLLGSHATRRVQARQFAHGRGRSQRQTPQQGKDQQDHQDHAEQAASRAENGVSATETVATAQQ